MLWGSSVGWSRAVGQRYGVALWGRVGQRCGAEPSRGAALWGRAVGQRCGAERSRGATL